VIARLARQGVGRIGGVIDPAADLVRRCGFPDPPPGLEGDRVACRIEVRLDAVEVDRVAQGCLRAMGEKPGDAGVTRDSGIV